MNDDTGWSENGKFKSPLEHAAFVNKEKRKHWFYTEVLQKLAIGEIPDLRANADIWAKLLGMDQNSVELLLDERHDYLVSREKALKNRRASQSASIQIPTEKWDVLPNRSGKVAKKLPGPDEMGIVKNEDDDWN